MKHINSMCLIFCGLLSSTIIASEKNPSPKILQANMSQSSDNLATDLSTTATTKSKRSFSNGIAPKSRDYLSHPHSNNSSSSSLPYNSIYEVMQQTSTSS